VSDDFSFTAKVFTTPGDGPWHMVTLPEALSDEIEARYAGPRRGFGAVRVTARIGTTTWGTSIFPDRSRGAYVMGIKRQVREAEEVEDGVLIDVALHIPDLR
jgi:hypothetical protein